MRVTNVLHEAENGFPPSAEGAFSWAAGYLECILHWWWVRHGLVARVPQLQVKLEARK